MQLSNVLRGVLYLVLVMCAGTSCGGGTQILLGL